MSDDPTQQQRSAGPASPPATRPARPIARPSVPTLASQPAAPMVPASSPHVADPLSELAAIAGTGIAPSASLPRSRPVAASLPWRRRLDNSLRETLLPSCLVLGITLPLLGVAWFLLDRHRVIRDNALGFGVPILSFAGGAIFLGLLAILLLGRSDGTTAGEPPR